jgi:L-asparagine transporter-like permease
VGCADAFKSILYTSAAATTIGHMFTFCTGGDKQWEPLYWLVFYVLSLSVHCYGGRPLWRCFAVFSITGFLLLIVYLLGSIPYTDLPEHAPMYKDESDSEYDRWFRGGFYKFMHALPYPSWFFIGIQNINLACGEMRSPKTDVPRGYLAAITTVVFTSFAAILVAVSVHPGTSVLQYKTWPLTRGYEKMFHISERAAAFISLPATVSAGFGFMFFYGRQLRAMGESGLLNPIFARELPDRHTPIGALLIGSLLSYGLCLLTHYNNNFFELLYNLSKLCAYSVYISIFLSFMMFRARFPTITREYVSPLGDAGAVLGISIFVLAFVAVCGFYESYYEVFVFIGMILLVTAYYHWVVEKRQVFSEEEKTVMFKAYPVKGMHPLPCARTSRFFLLSYLAYMFCDGTGNAATKNRLKKGASPGSRSAQRSWDRKSGSRVSAASPRSPVRREESNATTSASSAAISSDQSDLESGRHLAGNEQSVYSAASLITKENLPTTFEVAAEKEIDDL